MSDTTVRVDIPGASYDVIIGAGLLADAGERVRAVSGARKVALITDTNVAEHYSLGVDTSLARSGFEVIPMSVPAGESSKSWTIAGELVEALAAAGLDRGDLVVALGGGVVGDLAGFCAAVYLRGIDFVQIPTTLLAMVDSSVGGKTAVDLRAGKNLAGAFKQPSLVLADTQTLATLDDDQWRSGLAEAAKSAVLDSEEFLAWIEQAAPALMERESSSVDEVVSRCVAFKAGVVASDEREADARECLNYGHTLGHAIEKVAGYGTYTHGLAVAEGMRFAARVALDTAGAEVAFVKRQDKLLDALGLAAIGERLPAREVFSAMQGDKKARRGVVRMVLANAPGRWHCGPVEDNVVLAHLESWASSKGGEAR